MRIWHGGGQNSLRKKMSSGEGEEKQPRNEASKKACRREENECLQLNTMAAQ